MMPMAIDLQHSRDGFLDFHPTIQGNQGLELGPQESWVLQLSITPHTLGSEPQTFIQGVSANTCLPVS